MNSDFDGITSSALFLAGNLALDFINSEYVVGKTQVDCLKDNHSLTDWLRQADLLSDTTEIPHDLLAEARKLRHASRTIVHAAMNGVAADPTVVNQILQAGRPAKSLEWNENTRQFRVRVYPMINNAASILWPIANELITLIVSDKFKFVRECEAHDCVLLFLDQSKSHRRRWCSMATCGNRVKVAAFRAKK